MIIKFNNWNKYQPRKDIKNPWWFAFKNDFYTNHNFHKFTNDERLCFVYLLCEASKTSTNGEFELDVEFASRVFNMPKKLIFQTIEKLEEKGVCTTSVQNPYANRTESVPTEQYITQQNNTTHTCPPADAGMAGEGVESSTSTNQSDNYEPLPKPDEVLQVWNDNCGILPKASVINPKRAKAVKAALAINADAETWAVAIRLLSASKHHRGENERGWKADIDFFLQSGQFPKWIDKAIAFLHNQARTNPV